MVYAIGEPEEGASHSFTFPRFEVHTTATSEALPRIVALLTGRLLVALDIRARRSSTGYWIAFHLDVESAAAEKLAGKIRAFAWVRAVFLIILPRE